MAGMDINNYQKHFAEHGYIMVPGIISADEVKSLRCQFADERHRHAGIKRDLENIRVRTRLTIGIFALTRCEIGDARCAERSRPRLPCIKAGESDMADALNHLKTLPGCNGRAMAAGFCFGGPYAILGPKRLGFEIGFSCHGSQMGEYLADLDGVTKPMCFIWGDQDHQLPADLALKYREVPARVKNAEVHIFPGVHHGYMLRGGKAFDQKTCDFSMQRAFALLETLRG